MDEDVTDGASKVANSVGAAASRRRRDGRRGRRGRGHSVAVEQGERDGGEFDQGDGSGEGGRTEPVPRLDPDAPRTFVSTGSGGVV